MPLLLARFDTNQSVGKVLKPIIRTREKDTRLQSLKSSIIGNSRSRTRLCRSRLVCVLPPSIFSSISLGFPSSAKQKIYIQYTFSKLRATCKNVRLLWLASKYK